MAAACTLPFSSTVMKYGGCSIRSGWAAKTELIPSRRVFSASNASKKVAHVEGI